MNKKEIKSTKKHFFKGYAIGIAFCGSVALILLTVLWFFM